MQSLRERLLICGIDKVAECRERGVTHMLRVSNPGVRPASHPWFSGPVLDLYFGNVASKADADQYGTKPPTTEDVRRAMAFTDAAWREGSARVLVHCDYGASRSLALSVESRTAASAWTFETLWKSRVKGRRPLRIVGRTSTYAD